MKNTLKIALTSTLSTLTLLGLLAATPLARAGYTPPQPMIEIGGGTQVVRDVREFVSMQLGAFTRF